MPIYKQNDTPGDIFFEDWIDYIQERVGQEQWVTVYSSNIGEWGTTHFFCALIPNLMVAKSLKSYSWDLCVGCGKPGCSVSYDSEGNRMVTYHRYGDNSGVEPLIHYRHFYDIKKSYIEVSEEFRLFHNLYYDNVNNKFIKINDSGVEDNVIIIEEDRVQIKLKPLKQFLAIKEMHLAIYFSIDRYAGNTLDQLGLENDRTTVKKDKLHYYFLLYERKTDDKQTFSRLEGKKLISGMPREKIGIMPCEENDDYVEFIIDINENGEPIYHTCNPETLADYFGKNPHAPHYLTPVFFRREVLAKYYSRPDIYSIEDGYIRCGGLWDLQIDNNHDTNVIVFLGDLGELPSEERHYWKSYNVAPEGTVSDVNFKRIFLAQFSEPQKGDLAFKYQFKCFQEKWLKRFGWFLFKPLSEKDEHNFKVLRVPISDDQFEFDQQSLALTKVLVDSLNEKEIKKQIKRTIPREAKSISKLSQWLQEQGFTDYEPHIKFLRSLQDLRTGAAHRKGETYQRGVEYFKLDRKPLANVFEDILIQAADFLNYLDKRLL
jgi:hypothetical protein